MKTNILENDNVKKTIWTLGIPMILSMVLQALYNVVDTAFVINMGPQGQAANLALTYSFPIQILMIAVGVGSGVGINAMLSKALGQKNRELASKVAGNGIFIGLVFMILFMIFGIFFAESFINVQAQGNAEVAALATRYLKIVTIVPVGSIGFAVVERFVQATGNTMHSTIGQITGAVTNIVLDYVFIYPCQLGITGAALATVIGQVLSLLVTLYFHIFKNPLIDKNLKYIKPEKDILLGIGHVGISAMLMQALLSVMMFGVNMILATSSDFALLQGVFGIYYKIQQIALFASFGLSNTLITIVGYNYGKNNKERLKEVIKYGLIDSIIVSALIMVVFEIFASRIAYLFGLSSGGVANDIVTVCTTAIRIASLGCIFMGVTVAIQGVLQGVMKAISPLVLSLCRLVIFVFPLVYLFVNTANPRVLVWVSFPLAEILTSVVALFILQNTKKSIL